MERTPAVRLVGKVTTSKTMNSKESLLRVWGNFEKANDLLHSRCSQKVRAPAQQGGSLAKKRQANAKRQILPFAQRAKYACPSTNLTPLAAKAELDKIPDAPGAVYLPVQQDMQRTPET